MKVNDLQQMIHNLHRLRKKLKNAMQYERAYTNTGLDFVSVGFMGEEFEVRPEIALYVAKEAVAKLRQDCEAMARAMNIDHEELPLDE